MGINARFSGGALLYGALFVFVLPLLLILWARGLDAVLSLPAWQNTGWGLGLTLIGLALMAAAAIELWRKGQGLPMSPYPPAKLVTTGVYRFLAHPLYTGAGFLTVGLSLYFGSPGGLWIVSPALILSSAAFVLGYEREATRHRFPGQRYRPLLSIPPDRSDPPGAWDRFSTYLLVFPAWAVLSCLTFLWAGNGSRLHSAAPLPIGAGILLAAALLWSLISPLVPATQARLREYLLSNLTAAAFSLYGFLFDPVIGLQALPLQLPLVRRVPSSLALLVFFGLDSAARRWPATRLLWLLGTAFFLVGSIATGLISLMAMAGAILVYLLVRYRVWLWRIILRTGEFIANSWREWTWGPVRLMSHGFYGSLATFTGLLLVGSLLGARQLGPILFVAVTSMITAALWAQFIEGSKKLLRPLGFYGGVLGVILGCALARVLFGTDFILTWAAFAVAAPWIQAIGRLRCLVQGCCHGRPTTPAWGIRFTHPRSRVTRLSDLGGQPLYPTQIYSIVCNVLYGSVLLAWWLRGASLPLIIGLSFLCNGLCRFVEESYRGEPQTPMVAGLRLYQWIAIISVILGAILTTLPARTPPAALAWNRQILWVALAGGILSLLVTGVDFPRSNRRFSRLV